MENKPRSIFANSLIYGLMTGGAIIVYSLLLFLLDMHLNKSVSWISYVILIGGMVWGTIEYRKVTNNGFMTYGNAFLSSFLIGLCAGILASIYMLVFVKFIHPGFIQEMKNAPLNLLS